MSSPQNLEKPYPDFPDELMPLRAQVRAEALAHNAAVDAGLVPGPRGRPPVYSPAAGAAQRSIYVPHAVWQAFKDRAGRDGAPSVSRALVHLMTEAIRTGPGGAWPVEGSRD